MLSFVWAEDENHAIGYQGSLPWHLPADLKHFKEKTMGHPILMGRKTFASLPKVLPGRKHLILTHQVELKEKYQDQEQVEIFLSVAEMQAYLSKHDRELIACIGGSSLFELLKDQVNILEKTEIKAAFPADTYMPPIDYTKFALINKKDYDPDTRNSVAYSFLTYKRREIDNE